MKNSTKMIIYLMTMTSTLMVLSSSNWMSMWLAMEANLMSFIPLIYKYKHSMVSQSCMTYFLIQSLGSALFLMSMLTKKYLEINDMKIIYTIMMVSMSIKLGLPPFHSWMPQMIEKMEWKSCIILMTWQKLAPMFIMSLIKQEMVMTIMIMVSITTSSILGMNQTSLRKIMTYSSMNHMSWMLASMKTNEKTWTMYFLIYSLMMIIMIMYFNKMNTLNINQMVMMNMNFMEKINFISIMMSLGGLPPFFGFMAKWIVLEEMISSKEMFLLLFMMMNSLVTMFYYIRVCIPLTMFLSQTQKWMLKEKELYQSHIFMLNVIMPSMVLIMNFF